MKLYPFSIPFPQLPAAGFVGDEQQAKCRALLRLSWKSASLPPGCGVDDLRFPTCILLKVRRSVPRRKTSFRSGNTTAARPSASPDAVRLVSAFGDSAFPPYFRILLCIGTAPVFTSSENPHNVCRFSVGVGTYITAVKRAGGNRHETAFGECLSAETTERTSSENLQRERFGWVLAILADLGRCRREQDAWGLVGGNERGGACFAEL